MYTIVNDIKCSFAVFSALVITLITTKVKGEDRCSFQNFIECAQPLSVLTDSGLTFFNSKQDLEAVCPSLRDAIKCIHGFTRHCMNKEDRLHFKELFRGTNSMVHDLCRNGRYQEEYLKHAPCMTDISNENQQCFDTYTAAMDKLKSDTDIDSYMLDITSELKRKRAIADEGIKNVCCAFQQYMECSTNAVRNRCGENTAEFSRNFLVKMSASMLNVHCNEYGRRQCGLSQDIRGIETFEDYSSSSINIHPSVLSLVASVVAVNFLLR